MKPLTILLLLFISVSSYGQERQKPTLFVTGSARIAVKPDLGILNIGVSEVKLTMGDAISALAEKSNLYNEILKRIGFSNQTIKTTDFEVSKNRVYRDGEYTDSGYVATQNIRLEFTYDQNLLQKIVSDFSKSDKPIDFSFDFELSEQLKQKVQTQIIEFAVKDANEKAATIAKAAGQKLKRILTINYGTSYGKDGGMELIERNHQYGVGGAATDLQSFNFTPDDLIFKDTLTIEWFIE